MNNEELILNLQEWGLLPTTRTCDVCKTGIMVIRKYSPCTEGYRWVCTTKKINPKRRKPKICTTSRSLRSGTFFSASKLSIHTILAFVSLWVKKATLATIHDELELSQKTSVDWSKYCREVLVESFLTADQLKMGGDGRVVEIEESMFGDGKGHMGQNVEGMYVFGGYERETGRVFMEIVEERTASSLVRIVEKWIEPNTVIISDCCKADSCVASEAYRNLRLSHSIAIEEADSDEYQDSVEAAWKRSKAEVANGRRLIHSPGQLAKYLFHRSCKVRNIDPLGEFFRMAGCVYNPNNL